MNAATAFIEPEPRDPDGPAAPCAAEARQARQLGVLQELTEIGMQMARALRDEALAPVEAPAEAPTQPAPRARFGGKDLGLQFSRIAKAVRQTVALETHIAQGLQIARGEAQQRRRNVAQLELQHRQEDVREYVSQAVEADAARSGTSETEVERLLDDLDERIEEGLYDDCLADAPFPELIERICADLGVIVDWRLYKDLDWGAAFLREHTETDIGAERWGAEDPPADSGAAEDSS